MPYECGFCAVLLVDLNLPIDGVAVQGVENPCFGNGIDTFVDPLYRVDALDLYSIHFSIIDTDS